MKELEQAYKDLKDLEYSLTKKEYEIKGFKESYKNAVVKDLIEKGADINIISMPIIQGILNMEVSKPVCITDRRAFSYDPNRREIREDGTFDIVPCLKSYRGAFPIKTDYTKYSIRYINDDDGNYMIIECPEDTKIYLDKNGNITKMVKTINETDELATIYPKIEKKLVL